MMKHYKFVMEDGVIFDVIAFSWFMATVAFDNARLDPQQILAIEER